MKNHLLIIFCLKSHRKRTTHNLLTTMSITVYLCLLLVSWILLPSEVVAWIVPQPKANVWVTLAKALQQDHMCLSMGSVNDPLSSCLVGILLGEDESPFSGQVPYPVATWVKWANALAGYRTRGTPGIETIGVVPGYPLPQVFPQPEWSGVSLVRTPEIESYLRCHLLKKFIPPKIGAETSTSSQLSHPCIPKHFLRVCS